jgi:hypothetical protein
MENKKKYVIIRRENKYSDIDIMVICKYAKYEFILVLYDRKNVCLVMF